MTWKTDERHRKTFRGYSVVPQTNSDKETGHLIDLGDTKLRVLPDEAHSGLRRSKVASQVTERAAALNGLQPSVVEAYVVGLLAKAGLDWEVAQDETTFEEWLREWFYVWGEDPVETFLRDLERAGWRVVKA